MEDPKFRWQHAVQFTFCKYDEGLWLYFVRRTFFPRSCLAEYCVEYCVDCVQCIVYWINFQNIYTFTYQKTLLHTLLLLVFKIVEIRKDNLWLSTDFKNKEKGAWSSVFCYVKVCIFWKCIQCTIHQNKT